MRLTTGVTATAATLVMAALLLIGLMIGGISLSGRSDSSVDRAKIPPLAAELLPELEHLLATSCPDLPALWVVALAQAESSWNPQAFNTEGRAAGLLQMTEPAWIDAGGSRWSSTPPPADSDVMQAVPHLRIAIPWLCSNHRTATQHLADTGKPADPLDALLVCHIAGCGRVTGSLSGVPEPGEADCDNTCAHTIRQYIDAVHRYAEGFAAVPGPVSIEDLPQPIAFTGTSDGCTEPDPAARGCVTPAMAHTLEQAIAAFGSPGTRAPIRSVSCWDEHAWNPSSDHPHGRACDLFPSAAGTFPVGRDLTNGWRIASWLRAHARELNVSYLIWQGRFWSPTTPDQEGWGRPYSGGGIYDVQDPTGGHYDHIHVSVTQ